LGIESLVVWDKRYDNLDGLPLALNLDEFNLAEQFHDVLDSYGGNLEEVVTHELEGLIADRWEPPNMQSDSYSHANRTEVLEFRYLD